MFEFLTLVFEGKELRVAVVEDDLWFHGGDVCAALEIGNAKRALDALAEHKKRVVRVGFPSREELVVNYSYAAHMARDRRSALAKRFFRWLAHEVGMVQLRLQTLPTAPATALEALTTDQEAVCQDMRRYIEHENALQKFKWGILRRQKEVDRLRKILKSA